MSKPEVKIRGQAGPFSGSLAPLFFPLSIAK